MTIHYQILVWLVVEFPLDENINTKVKREVAACTENLL